MLYVRNRSFRVFPRLYHTVSWGDVGYLGDMGHKFGPQDLSEK